MRTFLAPFCRFLARFRYPNALPEEVVAALGVALPHTRSFEELLQNLTQPNCCVTKLKKYMPRTQAEKAFQKATCKERFKQNSLYSYYFNEGWMEFILVFDEQSRLRRLYLQHKLLTDHWELKLPKEEQKT